MSRPVYIYGVTDPRTSLVFYVGRSVTPKIRFKEHKGGSSSRGLLAWRSELDACGFKPEIVILETTDIPGAIAAEEKWISHHRKLNPHLLNTNSSGAGRLAVEMEGDWKTTLIRFRPDEYEALREAAYKARIPMSELVRRAVKKEYL